MQLPTQNQKGLAVHHQLGDVASFFEMRKLCLGLTVNPQATYQTKRGEQ